MDTSLTDTFVELHVPDFDIVLEFYGKLGFEMAWKSWRQDASLGYMVLRRNRSTLLFYGGSERVSQQTYFKHFSDDTKRGYATEIVIPVDSELDSLFVQVKECFPDNVVQDLVLKRWGKRDFRLVDPFGFYLRFTERYDFVNKYPQGSIINE